MGIGDIRERKTVDSSSLARDTARLAGRLAGKKRGREDEDDIRTTVLTNGVKKLKVSKEEEEEEEEESRTSTISAKTKQNGLVDRFTMPGKGKKKKGKNEEDIKPEPLFTVPSWTTPNPAPNTSAKVEEKGDSPLKGSEEKDAPREASLKGQDERRDTKRVEIEKPRSISPSKTTNGPSPAIHSTTSNPRQSPVISLSSSTSRYSKDVRKRLLMKQEALNSWRLIRVEKVSMPTTTTTPADEGRKQIPIDMKTTMGTNKTTSAAVPVLQLEPLTAAPNGPSAVMEGNAEQEGKKKKKRRKGKKKKEDGGVQEANAHDDEPDSD